LRIQPSAFPVGAGHLLGLARRHSDLLFVVVITGIAAVLRLWDLGVIPQGIHGDEAQVGMDARRVLAHGWIGPYTPAALGQPSGHAYLTAPAIELFGSTSWSVRLPLALVAIAAIPLIYVLFRTIADRTVATIAGILLTFSLWHIHYSRVAHWPISYVTIALAVLVFFTLGIQRRRWYWFALAGFMLGLGLYSYTIYPIFVIAFSLWVAAFTLVFRRSRAQFLPWAKNVAIAALVSVVVAIPLFRYMADPKNDYFNHYRSYYNQYSVLRSKAYTEADAGGRVDIIARQAKKFVGAYAWEGITDYVDGASPDRRPMLDNLTLVLFIGGAGYAAWRWRQSANLMSLIMVGVIPLTTVLQTNAIYRGPLGTVPFIAYLTAIPLALAWSNAPGAGPSLRPLVYGGVAAVIAVIAYVNVHAYFSDWAKNPVFPWVYAQQISAASEYIESLPEKPYIYFYSGRWSFNYETRQYLAPNARGEDRSKEFGKRQDIEVDRSRDVMFVLLPGYLENIDAIRGRYPGGQLHEERDGRDLLFIAYRLLP